MATATPTDNWTVLLKCSADSSKTKNYDVPCSSTVAQLLQRWAEDVGADADGTLLKTVDCQVLEGDQTLQEVGESVPGSQIVTVFVEESPGNLIKVLGEETAPTRVRLSLRASPDELEEEIRDTFALSLRHFRLRTLEAPLDPWLPLVSQGVHATSELFVELGCEVAVEDAWDGYVQRRVLYAGEPAGTLLGEATLPQRLVHGRRVVDPLQPLGAPELGLQLRLETARTVVAADHKCLHEALVWPQDTASRLVPGWPALPLVLGGRAVARRAPLSELGLAWCSLMHAAPLCVTVRLPRSQKRALVRDPELGTVADEEAVLEKTTACHSQRRVMKYTLVRTPELGTVADVEEAVSADVEVPHFALRLAGRLLESHEALDEAGIVDGVTVEAEPVGLALTVCLSDRSVRWRSVRRSLSFSQLMGEVEEHGKLPFKELAGRTLRCLGCWRRVWREEEQQQPIPAPCCGVRSLRLEEVDNRDVGTNTFCRGRSGEPPHRSVSVRPQTVDCDSQTFVSVGIDMETQTKTSSRDRGCQATVFRRLRTSQTETTTRDSGSQTPAPRTHRQQQHPPLSEPWPFRIRDAFKRRFVECDLLLGPYPYVGEVRAAVTKELRRKSGRIALRQWRGIADGREVVEVSDGDFGDAAGTIWAKADVLEDEGLHTLDDDDLFVLVPGRRNFVIAGPP